MWCLLPESETLSEAQLVLHVTRLWKKDWVYQSLVRLAEGCGLGIITFVLYSSFSSSQTTAVV